jgi:hypothetical protein
LQHLPSSPGFDGAADLARRGANVHVAWATIAGRFSARAIVYYVASLFLERKGAALRDPSRFMEFALNRKRQAVSGKLALLARCDLLRHL